MYLKIPPKTAQTNEIKLKLNPLLNNLWWSTIETTGILKINNVIKKLIKDKGWWICNPTQQYYVLKKKQLQSSLCCLLSKAVIIILPIFDYRSFDTDRDLDTYSWGKIALLFFCHLVVRSILSISWLFFQL